MSLSVVFFVVFILCTYFFPFKKSKTQSCYYNCRKSSSAKILISGILLGMMYRLLYMGKVHLILDRVVAFFYLGIYIPCHYPMVGYYGLTLDICLFMYPALHLSYVLPYFIFR